MGNTLRHSFTIHLETMPCNGQAHTKAACKWFTGRFFMWKTWDGKHHQHCILRVYRPLTWALQKAFYRQHTHHRHAGALPPCRHRLFGQHLWRLVCCVCPLNVFLGRVVLHAPAALRQQIGEDFAHFLTVMRVFHHDAQLGIQIDGARVEIERAHEDALQNFVPNINQITIKKEDPLE